MMMSESRSEWAQRAAGAEYGSSARPRGRWRAVIVMAATVAMVAASVAPAAAGSPTHMSHSATDAALPGRLGNAGNGAQIWASESSETATAPQASTGAAPPTEQTSEDPGPASSVTAVTQATPGGWWDGTASLAVDAPAVVEQGPCAALGDGWLALFGSGSLSKACEGADDSLSGTATGVGWVEGFDSEGPFVEVLLVGTATMGPETYQALGELDVVFDGGAFAADFARCEHQTASGWSSCHTVVAGATLPPGNFVGVGTVAIEPPTRGARSSEDEPATPAVQRAALVALYNATGGPNWRRNTNWNTTAPVADWYGVTTNDNGHVTHLYLHGNSLSGSIPGEIGDLTSLTRLTLSFNSLSGSIPGEIGDLTSLTRLTLSFNSLSGSIPGEIGDLTSLTSLWLHGNDLSGSIPGEIGDLTSLTSLWLHGNSLSGSIPGEIGDLTSLTSLNLTSNDLSGSIPGEIGDLTSLTSLNLTSNDLSGSIPGEIGDLTSLTRLALSFNSLSGSIPGEIGDLTSLTHLDLFNNDLSGSIPAQLTNLTSLTSLNLTSNDLSGSIPGEIGDLTSLTSLVLGHNDLSGSIPAQLGNLTSLTSLVLGHNDLSGSIPVQLGSLAGLTGLDLSYNDLSGSIPSTLGHLAGLRRMDLRGNRLVGCVPDALSEISRRAFDWWLPFCSTAAVSVVAARALETDDEIVLTVHAARPPSTGEAAISVNYETRKIVGSGHTPVSGVLHIGPGAQFATVSVPVVNNRYPFDEQFELRLTNPTGAIPAGTAAVRGEIIGFFTLNIYAPSATTASLSGCELPQVSGSVGDVFEIAQPARSQWHNVFVNVDLTCSNGQASGAGYPTAVAVVHGPSASLGNSRHCLIGTVTGTVTATVNSARGCPTLELPIEGEFTGAGRSMHIVRIPDSAIGANHQLRVWVDLDFDGVFDAGEPYDYVPSDFASREVTDSGLHDEVTDSGLHDYGFPADFEVRLLRGSTTVGRAGQQSVLRLRLVAPTDRVIGHDFGESVYARDPIVDEPVGARVYTGPSSTQSVVCFNTGAAAATGSGSCVTDDNGEFLVRYTVEAVPFFAMQQDELLVFHDRDRDGRHDTTEASSRISLPIAKAPNYIALGDSYSSGENGAIPTTGNYITYDTGNRPDGGLECRRWSESYPVLFQRDTLGNDDPGIDVIFATLACAGAITLNIYDRADPRGTSTIDVHAYTNRPSSHAPATVPTLNEDTNTRELVAESGWEPRQAVRLAGWQHLLKLLERKVDMITLTIGGNDAGFADVLTSCVNFTDCNEDDVALGVQQVQNRITSVLQRIKDVAPEASIFVLGYPYVTPLLHTCPDPTRDTVDRYLEARFATGLGPDYGLGVSLACVAAIVDFVELIEACTALSAHDIYVAEGWKGKIAAFLVRVAVGAGEAVFLRTMADDLNEAVFEAAAAAEVHYVDVVGGVNLTDSALSFVGHSPCSPDDAWLNGFVVGLENSPPVSDRSFHPNAVGQHSYSEILDQYIRDSIAAGAELNDAGLPVNAAPRQFSFTGHGARGDTGSPGALSSSQPVSGSDDAAAAKSTTQSRDAGGGSDGPARSAGYLIPHRTSTGAVCGGAFVSPGEQVTLTAASFAPATTVSFSAGAASLGDTELAAPAIADVTADQHGIAHLNWTVPDAPAPQTDPAPRAYAMTATGAGAGGGTHTAYMIEPLVAYPATAPCATADTATTALGRAVQIPVVANDLAPTSGSLDTASVRVQPAADGTFSVNAAAGTVTFTPDAGFSGTARTTYVVFDGWGIGVQADITVTVTAGCTITGTAGVVEISGTDGDDVICVPDPDDRRAFHVIDAKAGNDTILGGAGVDWIYGADGDDSIYGRGGDDRIVAGAGTDTVYGGSGMDRIYSIDLTDSVHDDPDGSELVVAPAVTIPPAGPVTADDWQHADVAQTVTIDVLGNDYDPNDNLDPATLRITRQPSSGAARVVTAPDTGPAIQYAAGAGGSDSLAYEICDRLGACAAAEVTIMVGTAGCTIVGTSASETLYGTSGDDVICGAGGDDTIYGLGGDDTIIGGAGDDTLYGGDATLIGGGDGKDILWGGNGDDTLYGGPDDDTLWGGAGADTLYGNRGQDSIYGGPGDDNAVGGGESDTIWGGPGDDSLDGHAASDTLWGGPGNDTLRGGNGDDTLWGGPGDDTLTGGAGADALHGGTGEDTLNGGTQNDSLWGGPGDDTLRGLGHDDQLHGGTGEDTLTGGPGEDRVYGGTGEDTLNGGTGTDYLNGGPDTDTCTRGDTTTGCEN